MSSSIRPHAAFRKSSLCFPVPYKNWRTGILTAGLRVTILDLVGPSGREQVYVAYWGRASTSRSVHYPARYLHHPSTIAMAGNLMQSPRVMKISFPAHGRMDLYYTEDPRATGFHVGAYMDMRHHQAYSRLSMTISDRITQGHSIQALPPGGHFQ
ncbi:hypothetical protein OH76DRAFT_245106 [Lentinus brumalis]|uniref:Uncharacterized protein n=1 Tax=Lentinus brumalis TaxID=2498619 RepID=A0A371CLS5_9APHY|nr:hypothetical protein OH76DRAFT_245106 [Polyporus brumalis]